MDRGPVAGIGPLLHAVREGDAEMTEALLRLSRSRRYLSPLAFTVGAFEKLFEGLRLLLFNWRLLLIQIPISVGLLGIGRRLEVRLRKAYLENLPKIEDRYFQSRLASDMASRCHAIQGVRALPGVVAQFVTISLEVLATAAALI